MNAIAVLRCEVFVQKWIQPCIICTTVEKSFEIKFYIHFHSWDSILDKLTLVIHVCKEIKKKK